MKLVFEDFSVENKALPNGMVAVRIDEVMEGVGPDGQKGVVATGISVHGLVTEDVAWGWAVDLAIASGRMPDHDTPEVADLSKMREEIEKRKHQPKKGPGR